MIMNNDSQNWLVDIVM